MSALPPEESKTSTAIPTDVLVRKEVSKTWKALAMLLPILAWVVLSAIPAPEGLTPTAWLYFALFAGVILGLVLEPIPGPVIGLLGITIATVLLPVFLAAAMAVPGLPLKELALLLCFTSGLSAALTPYASGPSAIFYGSGYIPQKDFWRLGLIFGIIFLSVYLVIGVAYLGWYLG